MKNLMTIMIPIAVLLAAAALAQGPDPLIQASAQATHAQHLFNEECAYDEGLQWVERAIETVKGFRSSLPRDRDAAGALLARLEIEREQLRRRRRQLDGAARQLESSLRAGEVETVRSRIAALSPPACDARFQSLDKGAENRAAEAAALLYAGDEQMRLGRPDKAMKLYRKAQQMDRGAPRVNERIAHARALKPGGRAAKLVGKAVAATLVVGGIAYAGYWAYRIQKEKARDSNVRFVPPPPYR